MTGRTWEDQAACAGLDPDLFFPVRGESAAAGINVCAGCPVESQCLVAHIYERFGVWGGMSERGRKQFRSHHRPQIEAARAACGLTPGGVATAGVTKRMLEAA